MSIFIISGKARHGKNTIADFIKEYYESKGKKSIITSYGKYIKMYAKEISDWDGEEETKPRKLLQELGTDIIRKKLGKEDLFVKRMIDDIEIYNEFFDNVLIADARFVIELETIKEYFKEQVYSIHVNRINFETELNNNEQKHASETGLDNYDKYDYRLINDNLEQLKKDVFNMLEEIEK